VGAVLVYHAISIWVPGLGAVIAWLSTRRPGAIGAPVISPSGLGALRLAEAAEADG
jgi:hypothetical protein